MFYNYFQKDKSSSLVIGLLLFVCLTLTVFAVYLISSSQVSSFELTFVEYSKKLGKAGGSVIPASCSSNPPTSHFAGDCPPLVEVGIRSEFKSLGVTITSVTGVTGPYSGVYYTPTGAATIHYTSIGGATKCYMNKKGVALPPSGQTSITTPPQTTTVYKLYCTDGVFWSNEASISLYSTYPPPPPPCFGYNC